MLRIGTGRKVGRGFVWISAGIGGFLYGCLIVIGILGIIALIIGATSH